MSTPSPQRCASSVGAETATSCSFCDKTIWDWICCKCGVRYCRECADTALSGAVYCKCCPSCTNGGRDFICPDVHLRPGLRAPAAVVLISVTEFREPAHHLMNAVVGALKCGDVKVYEYSLKIEEVVNNPTEYYLWLSSLPRQTVFYAFLVTETVLNGGWVASLSDQRWWIPEVQLLERIFNGNELWNSAYQAIRHTYLFILSCGGNFSPAREVPDLPQKISDWMSKTQIFNHTLAVLNSRLIVSEVVGFYALLVTELSVHNTQFSEALVQAYCRDETAPAHTDFLWLTGEFEPMVLRDSSGPKIGGLAPPHLCVPTCTANGSGRVKRGRGRELVWKTQCCHTVYILEIPDGTNVPEEHTVGARRYVLVEWPGWFEYTLKEGQRSSALPALA